MSAYDQRHGERVHAVRPCGTCSSTLRRRHSARRCALLNVGWPGAQRSALSIMRLAVPALLVFQRALAWGWLDSRNFVDAQQRVREIQAKFLSHIPAPAPAMDGASYGEQYEALLRVSVEDALDGLPPFPRLPACSEDPVALDNWGRAWDCWVADQAVKCQRPWLQPATPAMLAAFVETERRLRQRPGELDCPSVRHPDCALLSVIAMPGCVKEGATVGRNAWDCGPVVILRSRPGCGARPVGSSMNARY